jgi:hypothetical protein
MLMVQSASESYRYFLENPLKFPARLSVPRFMLWCGLIRPFARQVRGHAEVYICLWQKSGQLQGVDGDGIAET